MTDKASKILYLSLIFLINENTFLDEKISSITKSLVEKIIETKGEEKEEEIGLNLHKSENFLLQMESHLTRLVKQYKSVSFGDNLFTRFILFFLEMNNPLIARKFVLDELSDLIHLISFSDLLVKEKMLPFLEPKETDLEILNIFQKFILEKKISLLSNPFFYWFIVHHLSFHVFLGDDKLKWSRKNILLSFHQNFFDVFVDLCAYQSHVYCFPLQGFQQHQILTKHPFIEEIDDKEISQIFDNLKINKK
jgi:hypothetical protein